MIGLSAGINSAAVLVWLDTLPRQNRPQCLHLYHAHFIEHSADSLPFVLALVQWAKERFTNVIYKQTDHSIIEFFRRSKMIPHPANSPCSRLLKIVPMLEYMAFHQLDIDLIGYISEEKGRATKMRSKYSQDSKRKAFPIIDRTNEWCFTIVKEKFGWYPAIYDLRWNDQAFVHWMEGNIDRLPEDAQRRVRKKLHTDKRVFKHNNCLPCKNMNLEDMLILEYAYPDRLNTALDLSKQLQKYWGRDATAYYQVFAGHHCSM